MGLRTLATAEAVKLKKNAPARALKNITPARIIEEGLYGVLTGFVYGNSAVKLARRCALPYSDRIKYVTDENGGFTISNERAFTALEYYVARPEARLVNLCDFLSSKSDNLVL